MAENTKIEWADHTFNPWIGCTKISPACDNCYAAAWDRRFAVSGHAMHWGAGVERRRTSEANWRLPIKWNRQAEIQFSAWERFQADNGLSDDEMIEKHGFVKPQRPRVFCSSLADVFDNAVPVQWRIDLMRLILDTPNLDWLLLTKRIGNAAEMLDVAFRAVHQQREKWADNVPPNVWIGATICNQTEADRDIPKLLDVPAAKLFLSIEPLLGPVELGMTNGLVHGHDAADYKLDWVIVGGESGPNARPMHPDWARSLRDQCQAAGVPFFFKQLGEYEPTKRSMAKVKKSSVKHIPVPYSDANIYPIGVVDRVVKTKAGRMLDGRTWDEVPA